MGGCSINEENPAFERGYGGRRRIQSSWAESRSAKRGVNRRIWSHSSGSQPIEKA